MKVLEIFLSETAEEDRALISLSSAIFKYLQQFKDTGQDDEDVPSKYDIGDDEVLKIGTIGEIFDTPLEIFNSVKIELMNSDSLKQAVAGGNADYVGKENNVTYGAWFGGDDTMTFNKRYLDTPQIRSVITHELRHALDDLKSGGKAGKSKSYSTPKNPQHRTGREQYTAQPSEINARFAEAMNSMVPVIKYAFKFLKPEQRKKYIMDEFEDALEFHEIANLFPEKDKSYDYRRLIKRGLDFIQKEVAFQQQQSGK